MEEERLISAESKGLEESQDRAIRPLLLKDYVGQHGVKEQMDIFINAARNREKSKFQIWAESGHFCATLIF